MTQAEGAQAPSTLLGRAQEAIVHAAAATSAAGSVVANKVAAAGAVCADCSGALTCTALLLLF